MAFVNLTPHEINVLGPDGAEVQTIPSSGQIARITTSAAVLAIVEGVELFKTTYGDVVGLPSPAPGVIYIVSGAVAGHPSIMGRRDDVVSPGALVRGADGQPRGCRGLSIPG